MNWAQKGRPRFPPTAEGQDDDTKTPPLPDRAVLGVAPAALAQEALPDIDVGAPLRSRSAPAAPAAPSPAPAPAGVAATAAPPPRRPGARDQQGAVERDYHQRARYRQHASIRYWRRAGARDAGRFHQ